MNTLSHLTSIAILIVFTVRLLSNLRFLRWARRYTSSTPFSPPLVSVLIPARNEAESITPCVTSLLHQEYSNVEVIVLDDASTDDTGRQLDALAAIYPRLHVIHANENLPVGWNGKSYACHRLAEQAKGEWLLFTDADTEHMPQSVSQGIAQAVTLDVDLLSAFPAQKTVSWSERLLVSFIVDFLPLVGLNFGAIYRGHGTHTAGNGQYLLARAASYRKAGGHAAIYNETLDDFALAKHFRVNGYKITLVDGKEMLHCRMYQNASDVWNGFSRSLMLGLDNSSTATHSKGWMALFMWGYAALFINPFIMLFAAKSARGQKALALVEVFWLLLLRGVANKHLQRPLLEVATTPLAAWGVMALGISAIYQRWRGRKIDWKGRLYTN